MEAVRPVARRRRWRLTLALLLATAFAALTVAPAHAAAYRYWGFYQQTGAKWVFAQKGPDQTTPKDGSVEGWRFAVGDESSSRLPRATATFEQICADAPAQDGKKRVGLVIDFGRAADSTDGATPPGPKAVCAVVAATATSTDALRAAGELRMDKGLLCAIAGYPAVGCGDQVKQVSTGAKAPDTAIQLTLPRASASSTPAPDSTSSGTPGATASQSGASGSSAPAVATTTSGSNGSSIGTTIAYAVAALALIALIVFLVLRSRAARKTSA